MHSRDNIHIMLGLMNYLTASVRYAYSIDSSDFSFEKKYPFHYKMP